MEFLKYSDMFVEQLLRDRILFADSLNKATFKMVATLESRNKVLICGNGGSATDASHIAAELVGGLDVRDRPAMSVVSLASDVAVITAIANDYGYEEVFARQLQGLGEKGDLLWLLSTSGRSGNLLKAAKVAREMDIGTISFCPPKSALAGVSDLVVPIGPGSAQTSQEIHRLAYHWVCVQVETFFV